tara:strand:+ start:3603 stop:4256 length:654 start_codon:yes stop_codon:yes gene_type:complete
MSTTFAIISPNEKEGFKRLDIAHRSGIGNGLVKIKWLDFNLRQLLDVLDVERFNKLGFKDLRPYNIHVQAMDNTAQGVKTIGDLMVLDKYGTLKDEICYNGYKIDIGEIDKSESKYFDVEEINNDVISNTRKIKSIHTDLGDLIALNDKFIDRMNDNRDKIESNKDRLYDLSTFVNSIHKEIKANTKRIKAVETLFNNINEINYINNKTKGVKNETK